MWQLCVIVIILPSNIDSPSTVQIKSSAHVPVDKAVTCPSKISLIFQLTHYLSFGVSMLYCLEQIKTS